MEESENNSSRASQGEVDITGRVLQVDIRFQECFIVRRELIIWFSQELGSKALVTVSIIA